MGDASWVSTEPSTRVLKERGLEKLPTNKDKNSQDSNSKAETSVAKQLEVEGTFARLVPQNKYARDAFDRLAQSSRAREHPAYLHHKQFVHVDERKDIDPLDREDSFVFSLGLLPEFPALGWRIGKGRANRPNLSVDIRIPDGEGMAGVHARFCWVKGGGGFFLIADNLRMVPVILNGELLRRTQRLIPYRNSISLGECNFSLKFEERTPALEEQFQVELSAFYLKVLRENTPLLLPTPSGNEVTIGNWIVRNPIASGSYGRVSVVSHMQTGQPAAAKELWRTPRNQFSVDREISIAKHLQSHKHKRLGIPFEFYYKKIVDKAEKLRYAKILDENWSPGQADAIDLHILYSPLSTSNFSALIKSKASLETRTHLFAQVLDGVAFLHSLGISHRDIKPGNLTVKSYDPPDAQIIDFGCATTAPRTLYDRPGTIPYLAPEQCENQWHDKSVDYWACALVGAELVGLKRRSSERIAGQNYLILCHWLDDYKVPSGQPLIDVCKGMLKIEPAERMTAADALEKHLSDFHIDVNKGRKRASDENHDSASKGIRVV
ncbi:Serine/threonine-protein kinase grp [Lachnellula cervina]|uniref:Autophagy-related protein 1 n=1 Tax=Lachnellula cervina TaxID=1316786 RepID=A0A7D8UYN7_9HELO|nr:Serine/threonine-protein kinase grp [Lachnellula cervina]